MVYAIIVDSPATLELHRALVARLGDDHPGAIARFAGETEGGLRVISVWESKADSDRFFAERLGPMIAQMVGPNRVERPRVTELDIREWWVASQLPVAGRAEATAGLPTDGCVLPRFGSDRVADGDGLAGIRTA